MSNPTDITTAMEPGMEPKVLVNGLSLSELSHTSSETEELRDGLISHENEELRDRVTNLEKKVEQQEDEILCLKSALSDVIRRMTVLENTKGNCKCYLLHAKNPYTGVHAITRETSDVLSTAPMSAPKPKYRGMVGPKMPPKSSGRSRSPVRPSMGTADRYRQTHPGDNNRSRNSQKVGSSPLRSHSVERLNFNERRNQMRASKSVENLRRSEPLPLKLAPQRPSAKQTTTPGRLRPETPKRQTRSYPSKGKSSSGSMSPSTPSDVLSPTEEFITVQTSYKVESKPNNCDFKGSGSGMKVTLRKGSQGSGDGDDFRQKRSQAVEVHPRRLSKTLSPDAEDYTYEGLVNDPDLDFEVAETMIEIMDEESSQNNLLPSKTSVKSIVHKSAHRPSPSASARRTTSADGISISLRHSPKGSPRNTGSPSMKKWASASIPANAADQNGTAPKRSESVTSLPSKQTPPTKRESISHRQSNKEPGFMKEDGYLKLFMRGRPVTLHAPTELIENYDVTKAGQASTEKLKLEWVYGYRGRDCRSNVHFLPTGEIVYFIASVVVLYNGEEQMQRHYLGHNDDVKCLAVHPDKITIATGQVAGHDKAYGKMSAHRTSPSSRRKPTQPDPSLYLPHVRVWNSVSLATMHIIGLGDFDRAVCCLSFSKADGGMYLCAVDEGNDHILSIWDWQNGDKGRKVTETKCSQEPVLAAEFHPFEKNMIVTCGKSQLAFFTLDNGSINKKQGVYEKYDKPKYVLCLTFAENGDVITGDSNGNIFVWPRGTNKIGTAVNGAHDGGIFSMLILKDGSLLSGGGKDRKIVQWDSSWNRMEKETTLAEQYGAVRTLTQGRGNMILAGTTKNSILQGTLDLEFSPVVQGHTDELWGLAIHPNQHQFLSCAYDRHVYLWDALTHTVVWSKELNDMAHSACFYPEGDIVAIGTQTGRWLVIDTTAREIIAVHTDGNEQIECLEYSPDGRFIAIGSRDNSIYVYQTTEGGRKYSRVGKCTGHSSFITHLDWSEDSQFIQSNSGDYEILYWSSSNCHQVPSASNMRDVKWKTQSCTLGFTVAGIWPEGADGTDVNACARSHQQKVLASADDYGKVNLFSYPCCQPKTTAHIYSGHSSHVTNVKFLYDDSRLLSAGGKDTALMQWEII
ncbi:echinoderm microtubule-associated protein-like 2 isoform X5 [Lineus longissimus]|uniref:echinoderm microtubule-associated protein-like 2 isoform X5 n=1 Tax=Lineus longissimus TaxID=88925 RepID=UPI00315C6C97